MTHRAFPAHSAWQRLWITTTTWGCTRRCVASAPAMMRFPSPHRAQVHGEKRNIAYDKERCMGVGSTCTLVAERALSMPGVTVDSGLATLLLGAPLPRSTAPRACRR